MVKLSGTFSRLQRFHALVIGDFMLDRYTIGQVQRISPEAPVSILKVIEESSLPGGAGNVALNLTSLGANVTAIGRIGMDFIGQELIEKLLIDGIDTQYFIKQSGFTTPLKNRLVADGQQLLRVDRETLNPISQELELEIIQKLDQILSTVDVVAISDYGKGFLSDLLLMQLIQKAKQLNIPVIVDPKGEDFSKYNGADIIKPNFKEAYIAAKCSDKDSIDTVASTLFEMCDISNLLITMSKKGMALFNASLARKDYPVQAKEVIDVTGAGDTVLATLCACVANQIDLDQAIVFSNIAAGIVIEKLGCARASLSELAKRVLEVDVESKVFDKSHLFVLKKILANQAYCILVLNHEESLTPKVFGIIRELAKSNQELVLYIQERMQDEELISLLSSLHEVSYIILNKDSLEELYKSIRPERIFIFQNNRLESAEDSMIEIL